MTIEEDLVAWANTRPSWQVDVLKRICAGETFDDETIHLIAHDLVANGSSVGEILLSDSDLPSATLSPTEVRLASVHHESGVNALANTQDLTFEPSGLTVVYGNNASGKSGFARMLRAASGARVEGEILNNVFESSSSGPAAEILTTDVVTTSPWALGSAPNIDLRRMHFYDEKCGDAYLTSTVEISYRPSALVTLDRLIEICDLIRNELDRLLGENGATNAALPTMENASGSGAAFLSGLDARTTSEEISAACTLAPGVEVEFAAVTAEVARLRSSDPRREKQRLLAVRQEIELLLRHVRDIESKVSKEGIETLDKHRTFARDKRAAASVASTQDFAAEPIEGVGSKSWRTLWEAASQFGEAHSGQAHAFVVANGSERCVLCQQPLEESAQERFRRFERFMADTTEREARQAERELNDAIQPMRLLRIRPQGLDRALLSLSGIDPELAERVGLFLDDTEALLDELVSMATGGSSEPSPSLKSVPLSNQLQATIDILATRATKVDEASFAESLTKAETKSRSLSDAITLSKSEAMLANEVLRLKARVGLDSAKREVDTTGISRKCTDLTKVYVTAFARDLFTRETERLRLRRITLSDKKGVKGRLHHQPTLLSAVSAAQVTDVLSEGEQTALGLAGFLTEALLDESRSTVILDDPVTSLDHDRRALVAERLVEMAQTRQVIVLTHEATFVADLLRLAGEADVAVCERSVERRGEVPGYCTESFPWKAKDVGRRISDLTERLATLRRDRATIDAETYERECASWAGSLSETWERTVNVELVGQVVDRGTNEVRPKMFRLLAHITTEDDQDFQAGYGKCSLWAKRHDKALEVNYVAPEPDEMLAELTRFQVWFKRMKSYRNN